MAKRRKKPAKKPKPPKPAANASPSPQIPLAISIIKPNKPADGDSSWAKRRRDSQNRWEQDRLKGLKDIGLIPRCANPDRRIACEANTPLWFKTYLPAIFYLPFGPDHLKAIERLDEVIDGYARYAFGMPRGSGKTQLCIGGTLKAVFTKRRRFPVVFGATGAKAKKLMTAFRQQIMAEQNQALREDYPEFTFPLSAIKCDSRKFKGQEFRHPIDPAKPEGDFVLMPTHIACGVDHLGFGMAHGRIEKFSLLQALSIQSREILGTHWTCPDGEPIRPDMVLLDDVQDPGIAKNPARVEELLDIIESSVFGMAGPKQRLAALHPCTVRRPGDVPDQLLNREKYPIWHGQRFQSLYSFPENMDLWREYAAVRSEHLRQDGSGSRATEFYRANREAMDLGAAAAWSERFDDGEISAVQHAMNRFLFSPKSFWSEDQNTPLADADASGNLKADDLANRGNGRPQGTVPTWAVKLTGFADVQDSLLFWMVCAWNDNFGGSVIDYGTWPSQQGRRNYTLADVLHTLQTDLPTASLDAQIRHGLDGLSAHLMGREFVRDGGASVAKLDRLFVDLGHKPDVVLEFCRASKHGAQIRGCRGRGISAKKTQWQNFVRHEGERLGFHWLEKITAGSAIKSVQTDVNFWKTFCKERLRQNKGEAGALTFYDDPVTDHAMLIRHLCSEFGTIVNADGNTVEEWQVRPGQDNHFWDCLIGCAAAASFEGVRLAAQQTATVKRERRKFANAEEWRAWKFGGAK